MLLAKNVYLIQNQYLMPRVVTGMLPSGPGSEELAAMEDTATAPLVKMPGPLPEGGRTRSKALIRVGEKDSPGSWPVGGKQRSIGPAKPGQACFLPVSLGSRHGGALSAKENATARPFAGARQQENAVARARGVARVSSLRSQAPPRRFALEPGRCRMPSGQIRTPVPGARARS